jgi:pyridoxamine 5'-phosphate oxidase
LITFKNLGTSEPYQKLKFFYDKALESKQKNIEEICVSSYSLSTNEVDSRFVNLKFIDGCNFIFFSNYYSTKAIQFDKHDQISAVLYWNEINVQIRLKSKINRINREYNQNYFKNRSKSKNALAISSSQSKEIDSYANVTKNYENTLHESNLTICPSYWGGYKFKPYYFEFWEGHDSRINKREVYEQAGENWRHFFLQP